MKTKRVLTAKKYLQSLIIDPNDTGVTWAVIRRSDGTFGVHDSTNWIDPFEVRSTSELKEKVQFDEAPFIEAFQNWQIARETARLEKLKVAQEAEEKRVSELKERIAGCETPVELAEAFGLEMVDTAGHWSDLYEGHSGYAIVINDRKDYEIMEMAREYHCIHGNYGECRNRAGEHHHTFSPLIRATLEDYQKSLQEYFAGHQHYFYRSQDSESQHFIKLIEDIIGDDDFNAPEKLEKIGQLHKEWVDIEPGCYDCNGNVIISDDSLSNPDLTGYSEDVYTYRFAFQFDHRDSFREIIEEEEEIDEEL